MEHTHAVVKSIMALDFKADTVFLLHSLKVERVAPCLLSKFNTLCNVHCSPRCSCKCLSIYFSIQADLESCLSVLLPVIIFETSHPGPYVSFSFVFQVGFSNKQTDLFRLLALRSLPLNLLSITLTETGLCCQTQH